MLLPAYIGMDSTLLITLVYTVPYNQCYRLYGMIPSGEYWQPVRVCCVHVCVHVCVCIKYEKD